MVKKAKEMEKLIVIGDMHFSDVFKGSHLNYKESSYKLMERVREILKEEKADGVLFLGDFIGVSEKNIRSRQYFLDVVKFLQGLNEEYDGNVYSLLGNHDIGSYAVTDMELLGELGLYKNPKFFDISSTRFHLVNFGQEDGVLEKSPQSNVIFAHNEFKLNVEDTMFSKDAIFLGDQLNWEGADLLIVGHIHTPSPEFEVGRVGSGTISMLYTGAPSRVSERIDDCWYVVFEKQDDGHVDYEVKRFGLWPIEEEFIEVKTRDEKELEKEKKLQEMSLRKIIGELQQSKLLTGSLMGQIDLFPSVSDETKELAKVYLEKSIELIK